MVFLVRETLTEEDRAAWRSLAAQRERTARKKHRKAVRGWVWDKICAVGITAFGVLTLWAVASGGMKAGWVIWGLLMLAAGSWMFITVGRCPAWKPVFPPGRDFPRSGMPDTPVKAAFFGDGHFVFWDASEKVRRGYSSITAVWEDKGRFYLFFQDRPPLVLPKRGFAGETPEEFQDFLEGEFGWPVERIK